MYKRFTVMKVERSENNGVTLTFTDYDTKERVIILEHAELSSVHLSESGVLTWRNTLGTKRARWL